MSSDEAVKDGLREAESIRLKEQAEEIARKTDANSTLGEVEKQIEMIKQGNDALERELLRKEELRAKIMIGGRADAGQPTEKSYEEIANEEAKKVLSMFK